MLTQWMKPGNDHSKAMATPDLDLDRDFDKIRIAGLIRNMRENNI
jgi:hypothetical protein